MVFGKKPNNVLHALLTIFTCLLWGIIWLIILGSTRETRQVLQVDPYGTITTAWGVPTS